MFGSLGEGYGSVMLTLKQELTSKCVLKVYPHMVNYLKAWYIAIDLSVTLRI